MDGHDESSIHESPRGESSKVGQSIDKNQATSYHNINNSQQRSTTSKDQELKDKISNNSLNRTSFARTTEEKFNDNAKQFSSLPPYTIRFNQVEVSSQHTDRKLIEHLIIEWKEKNGNVPSITGRFGHDKCLLIFTNDELTFEDLLDTTKWPTKILDQEYILKIPRILPSSYSLVIQQFFNSWNTDEVLMELQTCYPTLVKLTRMYSSNNKPLNLVRADFHSSHQVKTLLNDGRITIGHMKNPVKQYYPPIKIIKCMKCYNHHHSTNECPSPIQLCIRCGQGHSFNINCQNAIKCINCGQDHYAGHSACPEVQQIRRQINKDQKEKRTQLLIHLEQSQNGQDANTDQSFSQSNPQTSLLQPQQQHVSSSSHLPTYASVLQSTTNKQKYQSNDKNDQNVRYIENIISTFTNRIELRLQRLEEKLINQVIELEMKVDSLQAKSDELENLMFETILPAIKSIQDCSFINTRSLSTREDIIKFKNQVSTLINKRNISNLHVNPSPSTTNQTRPLAKFSEKQTSTTSPNDNE